MTDSTISDLALQLRMAEAAGNTDAVGRVHRQMRARVWKLVQYAESADNREEMERRWLAVDEAMKGLPPEYRGVGR